MTRHQGKKTIAGSIEAPASKSSMQRAIACALLAKGRSTLRNAELCADSESALRLASALGATVAVEGRKIAIEGSPSFDPEESFAKRGPMLQEREASLELDCGESGLCMRMFSPIAALLEAPARLLGRGSLAKRPMGMLEGPLRALNVECRSSEGLPPIFVRGPLQGGAIDIDAGESSQLLTGLLIALPLAKADSELRVSHAVSKGYLDLTIDTCAAFGVTIERDAEYAMFGIQGSQRYRATDFSIEGDWSGAAFLIVAAAIAAGEDGLEIRGLQSESSQPDKAIRLAAEAAGTSLRAGRERLDLGRARLRAFDFDATDCPDLFPPLAALAAACPGTTRIKGVHRLKGKESDRAASLGAMLEELGVSASVQGDQMVIQGGTIRGGHVDACGDHRVAMAAAVAALAAEGPVTIGGAECVSKSWPGFFADLDSISR